MSKEFNLKSILEGTLVVDNEPDNQDSLDNIEDYDNKKELADNIEQSPQIVLISPPDSTPFESMTAEELEDKFQKYAMLTPKNKKFSNSYSMNIWGYDVPNMYRMIKSKIDTSDAEVAKESVNIKQNPVSSILESIDNRIMNNDLISVYAINAAMCENVLKNDAYTQIIRTKIDSIPIDEYSDLLDYLPKVVPYFTINEINEIDIKTNFKGINSTNYYKKLLEAKSDDELLSLGWNPSVPLSEKAFKFAREKQARYIIENGCKIIDISKLKSRSLVLNESSTTMRSLYTKNNLYPVYIVLSYGSIYGKMIRLVKHHKYTHAGLSLDSDLSVIMTYKFTSKDNGFSFDSIDTYIDQSKNSLLNVLCVFVDKNTYTNLNIVINKFVGNREKTSYGFDNLFNILINKAKDNDPDNLRLVCSQFVDAVLKLANIVIQDKPSNLTTPQDFAEVKNPKVFKLFEGKAVDYREKDVEDLIYIMLNKYQRNYLDFASTMNLVSEYCIEGFFSETDNSNTNKILNEIVELITPEAVIYERKFPIGIDDRGNVTIELYKSLEQHYQEAHRLLLQYDENNLDGIKHELARLFYLNSVIEKKIKKMKKDNEYYKKLVDLRARILNDFKKYFKVVLSKEPDFDFAAYFCKSEYYNGNIIIDNGIVKFTVNLIKKFLATLGI